MLHVPSHLMQPLTIDTNIEYDLDTSKFPGLNDEEFMYEPALLIATDWSQYVYRSACDSQTEWNNNTDGTSSVFDSDLFELIDSAFEFFTENNISDNTLEYLIDDADPQSSHDNMEPYDSLFVSNLDSSAKQQSCSLSTPPEKGMYCVDWDVQKLPKTSDSSFWLPTLVKGQKRPRNCEGSDVPHKKLHVSGTPVDLFHIVSQCALSKTSYVTREH